MELSGQDQQSRGQDAAKGVTRRLFLHQGAVAVGGIAAASVAGASTMEGQAGSQKSAGTSERKSKASAKPASFLDLLRVPDAVTVYRRLEETPQAGKVRLEPSGEQWRGGQAEVETKVARDSLVMTLAAPSAPVAAVHVRWRVDGTPGLRVLGDAWERSYGELGWRNVIPERIMPWYFATWDGAACHGYGRENGCGCNVLLAARSGGRVSLAQRFEWRERHRTRPTALDHGDRRDPARTRRRRGVGCRCWTVPGDVRASVPANDSDLWRQRLGQYLRAQYGRVYFARHGRHCRVVASRGRASLLGD